MTPAGWPIGHPDLAYFHTRKSVSGEGPSCCASRGIIPHPYFGWKVGRLGKMRPAWDGEARAFLALLRDHHRDELGPDLVAWINDLLEGGSEDVQRLVGVPGGAGPGRRRSGCQRTP